MTLRSLFKCVYYLPMQG